MKTKRTCSLILLVTGYWLLVTFLNGCTPTYPKEKFKECILEVCKKEYKVDVKVGAAGKTVAIYLPLENLLDFTFAITKEASEHINDVLLSVSRVSLSTDADYDFYVIIAHDIRIPEIQIVIIKSVDDVKRFMLNDISRGEYGKRMLIDLRMNPQAQKERAVKEIFQKMNLDKKWQEDVMNDFFRAEPTALSDIGYWNNRFYVKDIAMTEFLAEQVASRIKIDFREDKKLSDAFSVKSSKGRYLDKNGKRYFQFDLSIGPGSPEALVDENYPGRILEEALKIAVNVLRGYFFEDYDYIEIVNQADKKMIRVSREDAERFRTKKIKFKDILIEGIA
ncbi:MAG: hypothetical protein WC592_03905 [Candidatus Omnitrophota bacterium]